MLIFERFFDFLRPAFGHGRLGHPESLEYLNTIYWALFQEAYQLLPFAPFFLPYEKH